VEARLEGRDERNLGKGLVQLPHGLRVHRIVRGGDIGEVFHRIEQFGRDPPDAAEVSCEDRLEPDGRHLRHRLDASVLGVGEPIEAEAHGRRVIGHVLRAFLPMRSDLDEAMALRLTDAIDPTPRELRLGRQIEQSVLEARRAEVGDENFHGTVCSRVIRGKGDGAVRLLVAEFARIQTGAAVRRSLT
jgi:hypothetical protein